MEEEETLARTFLELHKQRNDKTLCDVTLSIEDEKFHCHRNVLAASSQYFATMFECNFVERTKDDIKLNNFDKTAFSAFLDLAYTRHTALFTMDNITDMLIMASMLMPELLERAAVGFMKHSICMENIINFSELSTNHGLTLLSRCCVNYLFDNFTRILQVQDNIFLQLPFQIFHKVFDDVEVDEKTYVKSILSWLKYDTERFKYAEQLIKTIRFEDIDDVSSLLNEVLDNEGMLFQIVEKYLIKFSITKKNRKLMLRVLQIELDIDQSSSSFRQALQLDMFYQSRSLYKTNSYFGSKMRQCNMKFGDMKAAILNDSIFFWAGDVQKYNFSYWDLKRDLFICDTSSYQPKSLQSMIGINEKNKIYASHQIGNSPPSLHCYDPVRNNWLDIEVQNNNIYEQCLFGSNDGNGIYLCGGLIRVYGTSRFVEPNTVRFGRNIVLSNTICLNGPDPSIVQSDIISLYDDRDKNQFQNVGKLVQGSHNCVATIMNNSIYVIDGRHTDTRVCNCQFIRTYPECKFIVQRYDIYAGKSELVSTIRCDQLFNPLSAATFEGKIWVSLGSFWRGGHVQCYDEKKNVWKPKNWNSLDLHSNVFLFNTQ